MLAALAAWNAREVLGFAFVARDDDINLIFNPNLGPPSSPSLAWMFTDAAYMRRYVPLGWLAFSEVYAFSGLSPTGYHAATLAFHAINTLLAFAVLLALVRRFGSPVGDGWQTTAAAAGAALWSLHPLRAETIGWCSGLLYAVAGFWALLCLLAYLKTHEDGGTSSARRAWLLVALLAYAFSVLTYPVGISLVAVLALIDWTVWDRGGHGAAPGWRQLAREKLLFLGPGAAVAAITLWARMESSSFWPRPPTWEEFPLAQRCAQAFGVWACYLWKTVWPANLTLAPTWLFEINPLAPVFLASSGFVLALTALLVSRKAWRDALRLWLCYLVLLVPLLGFTEHPHFTSDRYSYLAGVALSAAATFGLARCPSTKRLAVAAAAALVLAVLALRQREQLRIWENTDTLMARIVEQSGDLDFTLENHRIWAMYHAQRERPIEARRILTDAQRIAPAHRVVERLRQDLSLYENAGDEPAGPDAPAYAWKLHEQLALKFARAGRAFEAHEHFRAARELAPGNGTLLYNWAVLCVATGKPAVGLRLLQEAGEAPTLRPSATDRARLMQRISDSFAAAGLAAEAAQAAQAAARLAEANHDPDLKAAARKPPARP